MSAAGESVFLITAVKNSSQLFEFARRYSIAVWTVGAAFALAYVASPYIGSGVSPLFLLAVMFSAWRVSRLNIVAAILALAEGLTSTFVPNGGSFGFGIAFLLLLLVLLVRPSGLFGKQAQ